MSAPRPLQSFLGGLSLPVPIHALLVLNGSIFGVSGFIHRAIFGNKEALAGLAGMILGGIYVGLQERPNPLFVTTSIPQLLLSGFLVGLGSKLGDGCTSGHMLAGISRLSPRSIAATVFFFVGGSATAHIFHPNLPPTPPSNWELTNDSKQLLLSQFLPLGLTALFYSFKVSHSEHKHDTIVSPVLRLLTGLTTSFEFALALSLSNLTNPTRVISFLLLPIHKAFDPSLFWLACGAMPLAYVLYQYFRGDERPKFGGDWCVPTNKTIDTRLLSGALLFGLGWGVSGICPGPGLVNLGRVMVSGGPGLGKMLAWLAAVSIGGLLA
ncbi:hypothetical protein BDN72DRAFT_830863 [Pluteus cervinus]|uniref:Uncharacterized protein n=1 Tax=Pluteus cervinus TaxID=181527 RepID=A0ACD3BE50_9AGAR|nr:hypothetical protein BDN72DRAFT_830863 [Pluteus cervinus]